MKISCNSLTYHFINLPEHNLYNIYFLKLIVHKYNLNIEIMFSVPTFSRTDIFTQGRM